MSAPEVEKKKKTSTETYSRKAKAISARLSAVQAVYQAAQNEQSMRDVLAEYLEHRAGMEVDGEELVKPDGDLLKKILIGAEERAGDIEALVQANIKKEGQGGELLLKSILVCATFELLANLDIDAPIIINDYLNVAHSFYAPGEVSFINAILDSISKSVR